MRADDLVSVYEVPFRWQGEIIAGALREEGIAAVVFLSDFEQSAYAGMGGARVMVRAEDAPRARRIIDEAEPVD